MTNVATLISQDGIRAYNRNPHAGICKMQAMFIQWFMPADAFFVSYLYSPCSRCTTLAVLIIGFTVCSDGFERLPHCL